MEQPLDTRSFQVILAPSSTHGIAHADELTPESATKTSELLTLNHEKYHTRWSPLGFHSELTNLAQAHLITIGM